jgi:hypothetical protein
LKNKKLFKQFKQKTNKMSKVLIKNVRLSGNPEALVVDHKDGISGKINKSEDGRFYCQVELADDDLFKTSKRNMMYSSNEKGDFAGATPKQLLAAVGKELPGARVVTKKVTEYTIGENRVNQYTTIVLPKENVETVFKNAGHLIQTEEFVDESTGEIITAHAGMGVGA